jgi:hypothetical protein
MRCGPYRGRRVGLLKCVTWCVRSGPLDVGLMEADRTEQKKVMHGMQSVKIMTSLLIKGKDKGGSDVCNPMTFGV